MYVMIKEHYQFITLPLSHHSVTDKYFYITSLDDNIMMQSQNSHSFFLFFNRTSHIVDTTILYDFHLYSTS